MSFYAEWLENTNTSKEDNYAMSFLASSNESTEVFHNGKENELEQAINVINSISIEKYIYYIDSCDYNEKITASEVPQFSKFSDGICRTPELLEFYPEGITFETLGYQLVKSNTEGARIKYGENHSKLAKGFDLVEIQQRPSVVKNTVLGRYLIEISKNEKDELLRRLAMRQNIIKKIIKDTNKGLISYREVVKCLSETTACRRRNNVKELLEFVLIGTAEERRLYNIDWQVKK